MASLYPYDFPRELVNPIDVPLYDDFNVKLGFLLNDKSVFLFGEKNAYHDT